MSDKQISASLSLNTQQAEQSMGSFKKQLREATQDLHRTTAEFGETSKEAAAAAKRVAELRDNIGDANSLVAAFNPDRKFVAFGQAVQGVVGGFTALQGAMGLIGVESENVQKQLLKVQSALALTQGLDNIRDSIQGFKNLATVVGTQLTKAFSTLKGAIISSGIGALVIAVGVLIANFDKLSNAINGVDQQTKDLAESSAKLAEAEEKKLKAITEQDNILKLQGKTEKQILNLKIAQTDEVIAAREQQLLAQEELAKGQEKAAKRNHDILRGIIDFITKPIRFVLETAAKVSDFLGFTEGALDKIKASTEEANKQITDYFFDPKEVKKQGEEAREELENQITKLKNERAGFQLRLRDIAREEAKNADPEFERLKKVEINPDEDPVILAEKQRSEMILQINKGTNERIINDDKLRTDIEKANALQRQYTAEEEAKAKIAAAGAVGNALGALSDLVGKQTLAGKALGIAQATINTWIGATEVLRAKSVLPEPFGTIAKIANVAAIVASGLSAIKNIAKTQVPGGGGGAGAAVGSLTPQAPIVPIAPQRGGTEIGDVGQGGNAAVRAFVLESDVTNNQEKITRLNRAARIGG